MLTIIYFSGSNLSLFIMIWMHFIPGLLQLHYLENSGAAFGSMSGKTVFLSALTAVIFIAGLYMMLAGKIKDNVIYWSAACIIAGGAGNFIGRVSDGYVVDYFEFTFVNFAVFNFADILITVGAAVLVLRTLFTADRNGKKDNEQSV